MAMVKESVINLKKLCTLCKVFSNRHQDENNFCVVIIKNSVC
jgi:hypothetical protein